MRALPGDVLESSAIEISSASLIGCGCHSAAQELPRTVRLSTEQVIYPGKHQGGGLQLNADSLNVLNGMTFLSVDTILLVGLDFGRMGVNRLPIILRVTGKQGTWSLVKQLPIHCKIAVKNVSVRISQRCVKKKKNTDLSS